MLLSCTAFNNKPFRKNDYHFITGVYDSSFSSVMRGGEACERCDSTAKWNEKKQKENNWLDNKAENSENLSAIILMIGDGRKRLQSSPSRRIRRGNINAIIYFYFLLSSTMLYPYYYNVIRYGYAIYVELTSAYNSLLRALVRYLHNINYK